MIASNPTRTTEPRRPLRIRRQPRRAGLHPITDRAADVPVRDDVLDRTGGVFLHRRGVRSCRRAAIRSVRPEVEMQPPGSSRTAPPQVAQQPSADLLRGSASDGPPRRWSQFLAARSICSILYICGSFSHTVIILTVIGITRTIGSTRESLNSMPSASTPRLGFS